MFFRHRTNGNAVQIINFVLETRDLYVNDFPPADTSRVVPLFRLSTCKSSDLRFVVLRCIGITVCVCLTANDVRASCVRVIL